MSTASSVDKRPVPEHVLDEAIAWQLRLDGGDAGEPPPGLAAWLACHPDNARAWKQLQHIDNELRSLTPLRADALRTALNRKPRRRGARTLAASLVVATTLLLGGVVADRQQPLGNLLADHHTGTGEIRSVTLPDGTEVILNARSAIDLAFDRNLRGIRLLAGEISVRTAHGDTRPLVVHTAQGSLRALGTRFTVRSEAARSTLIVTQSAVIARAATCSPLPGAPCERERRIAAGQGIHLDTDGPGTPWSAPAESDAWRDGMLVVEDAPLGEVVAELRRHRRGFLSISPQAAALRVTGTVPLADTDSALEALTHALPVHLARRSGLWLHVEHTPAP